VEIFVDTANLEAIQTWLDHGVVDGVTTNPSIMLAEGIYDLQRGARRIAEIAAPRPVSIEVTTDDLDEMLVQARDIATWGANVVVKIPVITSLGAPCLRVVKVLEQAGIRVNVTACMSFGQTMLAAKAGATYVSIFAGRVSDEGHDASKLIRATRTWLDTWGYGSKIIVGSIREVINIQDAALAGAHVITIPPKFLPVLVDHYFSRETVRQFVRDGQRAVEQAARLQQRAERSSAAR